MEEDPLFWKPPPPPMERDEKLLLLALGLWCLLWATFLLSACTVFLAMAYSIVKTTT